MFCAFLFDLVLSIRSLCSRQTTIMLIFFYRTSLFITCSGLYGLFLFVVCIAFLAAEISTHSVPLHYFEVHYQRNFVLLHYTVFYIVDVLFFFFQGLFTYLYVVSILFLLYVFCFLLHEYSCCGGSPAQPTVRNAYFHVSKATLSYKPYITLSQKYI